MKTAAKLLIAAVSAGVLLQFVRPGIPSAPATAEVQVPPQVHAILQKDCYACHSNERRLAWFDEIVPGYWLVRHDVLTAREHLNFSTLGAKPAVAQRAVLFEAVNMVQLGAMPLRQFTALHPDAKVTPAELETLKAWLAPWSELPTVVPVTAATPAFHADLSVVQPELNGLTLPADFENWKPINFTDRGDNNTLRVILGNDVAAKAAATGNVSPWPDGAAFAKIAWQRSMGDDGLIHPGAFIQVEFMLKDAKRYKDTDGWGWGRWRGADLRPYGADAHLANECTGCHQPMNGNDFVYTLPITNAEIVRSGLLDHSAAVLPQSLPYQPLGWGVITIYVDPAAHTMATLYGNDVAMRAARTGVAAYPAGSVLALVTWVQRDDPHWFGGRIPATPSSAEYVQAGASGSMNSYRRFDGPQLAESTAVSDVASKRAKFIEGLAPAWLP